MKSQPANSPLSYFFSLVVANFVEICPGSDIVTLTHAGKAGPVLEITYMITGTPIVGTLFVAAFHAPEAGTMWQAQAALFTLWPFAQRPPHPDNRFFSLAVPWRLAGMAQSPSI